MVGQSEVSTVAVGYARRSKESGARTVSLDAQQARIVAYCAERGWTLAETVVDNGVSGGKRDRLVRLETVVRQHHAGSVVVYNLDRFARDVGAMLDALRAYGRRGIELHVVGRGRVEVDTASGFLVTGVEGLMAEHYRRLIGEKTKDALARLRANGRRVSGRAPYGYTFDGFRVIEQPEEQASLTLIRELAPGRSLRALSSVLAERGVYSRCGQAFSAKVLRDLIADVVTNRTVGNTAVDTPAVGG